jgi:hypothetical protein
MIFSFPKKVDLDDAQELVSIFSDYYHRTQATSRSNITGGMVSCG